MLSKLQKIGASSIHLLQKFGQATFILLSMFWQKPMSVRKALRSWLVQIYMIGVFSLPIIVVSGLFIGMVVGLQGQHILQQFGATSALGTMVALSVVRELGPVVSALLFAGRACSALTAEIGLMKTTDQLSSMDMMGVDPVGHVAAPRFWAGIISLPLLGIIFSAVAIYGGYFVGVKLFGVDAGTFWSNMQNNIHFATDVVNGIIKSVIFGVVATWIAIFQGLACVPTSEGMGRATTKTVVYASLAILGLDFILTAMMMGGW